MDDRTPQDVAAEDAAVARLRAADPGAGVVPDTVALRSTVDERRAAPDVRADVPEMMDDADPASLSMVDEEVRAVLAALSPRDRQVLLLHAWDGLDGDHLAEVLGIGRGGADAALSRARAHLRQAWADQGAEALPSS